MKRGSILDLFMAIFILLVFSIFVLIFYTIGEKLEPALNDSGINASLMGSAVDSIKMFDMGMFLIFITLCFTSVVGAFFVSSHPIFFFFSIIAILILVIVAVVVSSAYVDIGETPALQDAANEFVYIKLIHENLLTIVLVMAFVIVIALYAKPAGAFGG